MLTIAYEAIAMDESPDKLMSAPACLENKVDGHSYTHHARNFRTFCQTQEGLGQHGVQTRLQAGMLYLIPQIRFPIASCFAVSVTLSIPNTLNVSSRQLSLNLVLTSRSWSLVPPRVYDSTLWYASPASPATLQ
jgi:hypothetical protein